MIFLFSFSFLFFAELAICIERGKDELSIIPIQYLHSSSFSCIPLKGCTDAFWWLFVLGWLQGGGIWQSYREELTFFPPERNGTHDLPNYRHVCREMKMLTAHLKGKNPFPSCQHHTVICFLSVEANITTKSHLSFLCVAASSRVLCISFNRCFLSTDPVTPGVGFCQKDYKMPLSLSSFWRAAGTNITAFV